MSSTVAEPRSPVGGTEAGDNQHVTDDSPASNPALDGLGDEGVRVDDGFAEEGTQDEQQPEQSETAVEPEPEVTTPVAQVAAEQIAQVQRENAELRGIVDDVYRRMQADPELARKLGAGGEGSNAPVSILDQVDQTLRGEGGLTREAADVVMRAFTPMLKDYENMKRELSGVRPQLEGLSRAVGSTEYQKTLVENGVSQDIQKTPQFQKFARQVESDPRVRGIRDTTIRAEFVAAKWNATESRKAGYREDRTRLVAAKAGRGTSQPSRGASTAQRIVEITRGPDMIDRADRIRMEAYKNGKPLPTIKYVNPK